MVKIQTKNAKVFSSNLIMPEDGMVEIDANGIVEVSDTCAEIMCTCTSDWERVEVNADTDDDDDAGDDKRAELEAKVKKATVDELKAMCEEMEFDEEEYGKLSKKNLQKYIMDKYDELNEPDGDDDEEEED